MTVLKMPKNIRTAWIVLCWMLLFMHAVPAVTAEDKELSLYHGNKQSKVFHRKGCRYYDCSKCSAVFKTRAEAVGAGYKPCKICKP